MARKSRKSSLAPGFRFHPTDEELVLYYLRRKLTGRRFRFDAIADVDVYKSDPWDLPNKSKLKTRDLEWYFFCALDKKYGNKLRTNRATGRGYWKTTGKDRAVSHGSRVVGMKKTLVFHHGRAPHGKRTNWVMHEYRLADEEFKKSGIKQGEKDAFVLCRIFEKSGPGPKNGEKYGAPFVEEEWEDDEVTYFPGQEAPVAVDLALSEECFLGVDDIEQRHGVDIASGNDPLPQKFYYGESSKSVESSRDIVKDDQDAIRDHFEAASHLHLGGSNKLDDIPGHPVNPVPDEPEDDDFYNFDYLLEGPFSDANEMPTSPVEGDAVSHLNESDTSAVGMLEEYLSLSNREGACIHILGLEFPQAIGCQSEISEQSPLSYKPLNEWSIPDEHFWKAFEGDGSSSSDQLSEAENAISVRSDAFIKKASQMLGNIPAPSAFAAEFPSKEAMLQLKLANPLHIMPGLRVTNLATSGEDTDLLPTDDMDANFFLHGLSQGLGYASLVPLIDLVTVKSRSLTQRSIWFFFFIWVVISISFKLGTFVCGR